MVLDRLPGAHARKADYTRDSQVIIAQNDRKVHNEVTLNTTIRAEYREKVLLLRRNMIATQALLTRVEKGAVLLREKLAAKAAQRAERRSAEEREFMVVGRR